MGSKQLARAGIAGDTERANAFGGFWRYSASGVLIAIRGTGTPVQPK
jgi:hypothetical protein